MKKCSLLGDLWLYRRPEASQDPKWRDFFEVNDIALPMAYAIASGFVEPVAEEDLVMSAFSLIDETWTMLCKDLGVSKAGKYKDIDAMLAASPKAPRKKGGLPRI